MTIAPLREVDGVMSVGVDDAPRKTLTATHGVKGLHDGRGLQGTDDGAGEVGRGGCSFLNTSARCVNGSREDVSV